MPNAPLKPFLTVALVGSHDPAYPRNRSVRAALGLAGHRILECHSRARFPGRYASIAWQYLRIAARADILLVTEGGHRLMPLLRLLALATNRKIVFDPFLSRYNTRIEDRGLHGRRGLEAWISKWQDWSSTHAAHGLLFDTREHQRYFFSRYRLRKPFAILPVGADETVFDPGATPGRAETIFGGAGEHTVFKVLFYGTYIPLQGVEHILEAAAIVQEKDPSIRFQLIGEGQTHAAMRTRARRLNLRNVAFEPLLPVPELPGRIAAADVCLGIFGTTLKAQNVVPNKVVQAAAMGAALVTADTPAIRHYFRDGESVVLVPAGNGQALAEALMRLRVSPERLEVLRSGSRRAFGESFSLRRQSEILDAFLRAVHAGKAPAK